MGIYGLIALDDSDTLWYKNSIERENICSKKFSLFSK